jgi:hypothetical protein
MTNEIKSSAAKAPVQRFANVEDVGQTNISTLYQALQASQRLKEEGVVAGMVNKQNKQMSEFFKPADLLANLTSKSTES